MHRFSRRGGHVFGLPAAFEHDADLFSSLKEWRIAAGFGQIGVEVGMLSP